MSVEQTAAAALAEAGVGADDLAAIGITNQRETTGTMALKGAITRTRDGVAHCASSERAYRHLR